MQRMQYRKVNKRILIIANDVDIIINLIGISFFGDIGAAKLWV